MKQFQFTYHDHDTLQRELVKIRQWSKSHITSVVVFQVYSELLDRRLIDSILGQIRTEMPSALIMGCSTNGNIREGRFSDADIQQYRPSPEQVCRNKDHEQQLTLACRR